MTISLSSPVTGAAITGLTSPTYTHVADVAPASNGKQYAVTGLGGTQTGVDVHSVAKPFTATIWRPTQLKTLPQANPITGVIKNVPFNNYKVNTRKGVAPAVNQNAIVMPISTSFGVPAGSETYEPEDVIAGISFHIGVLWQLADSIATMAKTGIM